MADEPGIALYVHIPFCLAKCAYCDFVSYDHLAGLYGEYTSALVTEMDLAEPGAIRSIYIGGGTPTVLPLLHFERIFEAIQRRFAPRTGIEITVEANPGTVSPAKLDRLRALGVTRLSLGVQSFVEKELRLLGRIHSAPHAIDAFQEGREAGFDNLSLDLIYGLPRQSLGSWRASLQQALALQPDHLSLYALTVEEGTPLAADIAQGRLPAPDPDLAADMYELAQETLSAAGFVHYEISNWARSPEFVSRHNLIYWQNEPYLGIGAGAHSWRHGRRWSNVTRPEEYIGRVRNGLAPTAAMETIGPELEMGETMMLGLRLLGEGVAFARFQARFGLDLRVQYAGALEELPELGLIEITDERVVLSKRGRLLGNQVFLRFLGD
jgi:oxygen-independent coproporphyrinogen-3 oxidase